MKKNSLLVFLLFFATACYGQASKYSNIALNGQGRPLAGVSVAVCTQPATQGTINTPCSPLATLYTSTTGLTPSANPVITDGLGNYSFYATPGTYTLQLYGPSVQPTLYVDIIVPCAPGINCGGGGGPQSFSTLTPGTNNNGALVVGPGSTLSASGGQIRATTSAALAATPLTCTLGTQAAGGIAANGNAVGCFTPAGAGVSSLNSLTGALTIAPGTNITVVPSGGNTLTINASAGAGTAFSALTSGTTSNTGTFGGSGNTWDFSGALSFKIPLIGNAAVKPAAADSVVFSALTGNDSNDANSLGSAAATLIGGFNKASASGGFEYIENGSASGPSCSPTSGVGGYFFNSLDPGYPSKTNWNTWKPFSFQGISGTVAAPNGVSGITATVLCGSGLPGGAPAFWINGGISGMEFHNINTDYAATAFRLGIDSNNNRNNGVGVNNIIIDRAFLCNFGNDPSLGPEIDIGSGVLWTNLKNIEACGNASAAAGTAQRAGINGDAGTGAASGLIRMENIDFISGGGLRICQSGVSGGSWWLSHSLLEGLFGAGLTTTPIVDIQTCAGTSAQRLWAEDLAISDATENPPLVRTPTSPQTNEPDDVVLAGSAGVGILMEGPGQLLMNSLDGVQTPLPLQSTGGVPIANVSPIAKNENGVEWGHSMLQDDAFRSQFAPSIVAFQNNLQGSTQLGGSWTAGQGTGVSITPGVKGKDGTTNASTLSCTANSVSGYCSAYIFSTNVTYASGDYVYIGSWVKQASTNGIYDQPGYGAALTLRFDFANGPGFQIVDGNSRPSLAGVAPSEVLGVNPLPQTDGDWQWIWALGKVTDHAGTGGARIALQFSASQPMTFFAPMYVQIPSSSIAAMSPCTIASTSETGNTGNVITSASCPLSVGQPIVVSGVSVAGYNGGGPQTVVTSVTNATHFSYYVMAASLGAGSGGTVTPGNDSEAAAWALNATSYSDLCTVGTVCGLRGETWMATNIIDTGLAASASTVCTDTNKQLTTSGCSGGGGSSITVNGSSPIPSPANFQNQTTPYDGISVNFSNPSAGNVQATLAGNATEAFLPATTVFTDTVNTYAAHLNDFSLATIKIPASAGFTATAARTLGIDTTAQNLHTWLGADSILPFADAPGSWVNGDCGTIYVSGGQLGISDAGAPCATGSTASWSTITSGTNSNAGNFIASGNVWNFAAATSFKVVSGAGAAPTADGLIAYNTTTHLWAFGQNGATLTLPQSITAVSTQLLSAYNAVTGAFSQRALISGDIPNNAANTTGNAATATALASTPTLCTTGQAPTGILANGNATACAAIGGNSIFTSYQFGSQTAITGTSNYLQTTYPSIFTLAQTGAGSSGSPFVDAISMATQTANTVLAGPTIGAAAASTFRALVSADIPNNAANTTGLAGTATAAAAAGTQCASGNTARGVDTIWNAIGCTAILTNPMTTLGDEIYGGASGVFTRIAGPTTPNGIPQLFTSTPSGAAATAPAWAVPGVGIDAQTGTTFTVPVTDDVHYITGNNSGATAWTGFTLANNYAFSFQNLGAGLITFTPASGNVNGGATQIIPQYAFGFHYTDNTNTFMPVMPTLLSFPNCTDTTGQHVNFTSATGKFSCGTSSTGTISGLTTGYIPEATGATAIGNSLCDDGITTSNVFTCTDTAGSKFVSVATGTSPPTCAIGTAGTLCEKEGTAPTAASAVDQVYADSTAHNLRTQVNGGSPGTLTIVQPGAIRSTGLTAAVTTATLCAASAGACNQPGMYHVHISLYQSGSVCTTNTTGGVTPTLTWTDGNGTAHSVQGIPLETNSSLIALSGTMLFNQTSAGLGTVWGSGDMNIDTNGTIIQYAIGFAQCSVTGSATYAASLAVTRLQ